MDQRRGQKGVQRYLTWNEREGATHTSQIHTDSIFGCPMDGVVKTLSECARRRPPVVPAAHSSVTATAAHSVAPGPAAGGLLPRFPAPTQEIPHGNGGASGRHIGARTRLPVARAPDNPVNLSPVSRRAQGRVQPRRYTSVDSSLEATRWVRSTPTRRRRRSPLAPDSWTFPSPGGCVRTRSIPRPAPAR